MLPNILCAETKKEYIYVYDFLTRNSCVLWVLREFQAYDFSVFDRLIVAGTVE